MLALSCNFQILFLVLRSHQLPRLIYLLTYMGVFNLAFALSSVFSHSFQWIATNGASNESPQSQDQTYTLFCTFGYLQLWAWAPEHCLVGLYSNIIMNDLPPPPKFYCQQPFCAELKYGNMTKTVIPSGRWNSFCCYSLQRITHTRVQLRNVQEMDSGDVEKFGFTFWNWMDWFNVLAKSAPEKNVSSHCQILYRAK